MRISFEFNDYKDYQEYTFGGFKKLSHCFEYVKTTTKFLFSSAAFVQMPLHFILFLLNFCLSLSAIVVVPVILVPTVMD